VDFCYERRQEVIDYVNRKYGADHVAQIVTFGTMAARNAIRDVGRVMGIPYQQVDVVAKLVPMELKMTLKRALEVSSELKKLYDTDPQVTELIDTALKVEGMPRHASTHAASCVQSLFLRLRGPLCSGRGCRASVAPSSKPPAGSHQTDLQLPGWSSYPTSLGALPQCGRHSSCLSASAAALQTLGQTQEQIRHAS